MSTYEVDLSPRQKQLAKSLIEWRDGGGQVEMVIIDIQRLIISELKDVFVPPKEPK